MSKTEHDLANIVTEDEIDSLVLSLVGTNGPIERERLEAWGEKVIEWAQGARIDAALLANVLDGKIEIVLPPGDDGEFKFRLVRP